MDNKYLDEILTTIRDKYNGRVETLLFIAENPSLTGNKWSSAYSFLLQKKLLLHDYNGKFITVLTPEGERFLVEGGFTSDAEYKEQTLEVAKESKKYAKLAFWISVLGILVTIALFLLDRVK